MGLTRKWQGAAGFRKSTLFYFFNAQLRVQLLVVLECGCKTPSTLLALPTLAAPSQVSDARRDCA